MGVSLAGFDVNQWTEVVKALVSFDTPMKVDDALKLASEMSFMGLRPGTALRMIRDQYRNENVSEAFSRDFKTEPAKPVNRPASFGSWS